MTDRKDELAANLAKVEGRIAAACAAAGRGRDEVTLVVVTKTYPASDVRILSGLGVRHVAENRDQDAAPRRPHVQICPSPGTSSVSFRPTRCVPWRVMPISYSPSTGPDW
ncbi:hypothetical protein SHKM778_71210 [Streptomyces sp. KM77-8]|uniref:YggS family pyridoxal phosphate enzyme n=1 Tax=Streptomyces haneummycinicus TaxID=3074435 RepID=A0AAT9HT27_9ACTN